MSKIAEKKALETYPILFSERNGYNNTFKDRRESYIKGYDQAMRDFFEKAEKILTERMYFSDDEVKEFKNYMKNEIQN